MGKNGKSTKHRKTRWFLAGGSGSAAGGAAPLSYGEERNAYGKDTGGGPWPDLSAYARHPARGPTMLAHLVAMLAYVGLSCGLCWPSLGLCWTSLKAMWADREAYVGRS